jgi:hypothetical protein
MNYPTFAQVNITISYRYNRYILHLISFDLVQLIEFTHTKNNYCSIELLDDSIVFSYLVKQFSHQSYDRVLTVRRLP